MPGKFVITLIDTLSKNNLTFYKLVKMKKFINFEGSQITLVIHNIGIK